MIAKGTSEARVPAANLLFHYWPLLNPHILDRKPIQYRPHGWCFSPLRLRASLGFFLPLRAPRCR